MSRESKDVGAGAAKLAGLLVDLLQKLRDGTRTIAELERFLRGELVIRLGDVDAQLARWAANYHRKGFGFALDTSKLIIPPKRDGFDRLVVVPAHECINPESVFDVCQQCFPTRIWMGSSSLNENIDFEKEARWSSRDGPYAIWVRDRVEVEGEHADKSALEIERAGISGTTLLERMLLELDYYWQTGQHLDMRSATLCTGSRFTGTDGDVPSAKWDTDYSGGEFYVGFSSSLRKHCHYRVREVVAA